MLEFKVKVPWDNSVPSAEWMDEHFGAIGVAWNLNTVIIAKFSVYSFANEQDALMFQLRWV